MGNNTIPAQVLAYMAKTGYNKCNEIVVDGEKYYSLYRADRNGETMPTGLPCVVTIAENGKAFELPAVDAFSILSDQD